MNPTLKILVSGVALCLALGTFMACGDDEGGSSSSSSGSSQCDASHMCMGSNPASCGCTTTGKEGTSCCGPDDCDDSDSNSCAEVCKVCN